MKDSKYPTSRQKELISTLGGQILDLIKYISGDLTTDYYEKVYGTAKFLNIKENKEVSDLISSLNRLKVELSVIYMMKERTKKDNIVNLSAYELTEKHLRTSYYNVESYLVLPLLELVIEKIRKELKI